MNSNNRDINLIGDKDYYFMPEADRDRLRGKLAKQGFDSLQIAALYELFKECHTEEMVAATAWESAQESRAMCSKYVACNPVYLALKRVDLELDTLEDEILHIRQRLTPFVRCDPDVYTVKELDQIHSLVHALAYRLAEQYQPNARHLADHLLQMLSTQIVLSGEPDVMEQPRDPSCVALGEMVEEPPDQSQDHPACGDAWDLEPDDDDGIPF